MFFQTGFGMDGRVSPSDYWGPLHLQGYLVPLEGHTIFFRVFAKPFLISREYAWEMFGLLNMNMFVWIWFSR